MKQIVTRGALLALAVTMSSSAWAFADDEARTAINQLRQQLKVLTETSQRVNIQMSERIDLLELEVSRLRAMVEELGGRPPGAQSSSATATNAQEQEAFDGALDFYRQGKVKEAAESLKAFLTLYPNSPLAPAAMFYLGSSQYANKDYKGSIATLQNMVSKYPKHDRAPDALLVIAGAQFELNDRAGTKATLQKIVKEYGSSAAAQTAQQRLKLL